MTLVLGFAPFILFVFVSRLSVDLALWCAFAAAFVVTIRDFVERPILRLLDGTSLVVFGLLALWRGFVDQEMPLADVRVAVDAGLFASILFSLLRGRPFSLQYAAAETAGRVWPLAIFLKVNYAISGAWAAAFAAMSLTDIAAAYFRVPFAIAVAVSMVALGAAIAISLRYPERAAARLA